VPAESATASIVFDGTSTWAAPMGPIASVVVTGSASGALPGGGGSGGGGGGGGGGGPVAPGPGGGPPSNFRLSNLDLLDLTVSQRQLTFAWNILDRYGNVIGQINPDNGQSVPSVSVNTGQAVMRQLDGLILTPSDSAALNPLTDRVQPVLVLPTGGTYSLGVFLFSAVSWSYPTWGAYYSGSMQDRSVELQADIGSAYNLPVGDEVFTHMQALAGRSALTGWNIDPTGALIGSATSYTADTPILTILNDLAVMAGMYPVFVDNNGNPRLLNVGDANPNTPLVYSEGVNIFADTLTRSSGLIGAPNRWIVEDATGQNQTLLGIYDLPPEAPNSFAQLGYYVTASSSVSGLNTQDQVNAAAKALAVRENVYGTWSWSGPPDPRHDTFDDILLNGDTVTEISWTMQLSEGTPMTHTAVTRWADTDLSGGGA
jgi:hypothetical protein